jgi:anti-anti-sigma factor
MLSSAARPAKRPPPGPVAEAGMFSVTTSGRGTERMVALRGELDIATAGQLADALAAEVGEADVIVDLEGLSFCDCAGLDVLLTAHERQRAHGARLLLTNPTRTFRRLLSLSGLDAHFDVRVR